MSIALSDKAATRILQVIAPAPFGGAETAVLSLIAGLRRMAAPVELAILADARSGPFVTAAKAVGVPVHVLDSVGRSYLGDVRGLRSAVRAGSIDVVHTHGYRADILGWLAARAEDRPLVCTAHGFTGGSWRNRLNQFLGVRAMCHADAVVAVSAALGTTLEAQGVPATRIRVMPNAWAAPGQPLARAAARRELGLDQDALLVGWVGRVSAEKGPDLAVAAQASFGATLVMIGDGPEREAVEHRAGRSGTSGVRWLGARPGVWSVLPAFDVLLLSSRTEGTPMILLEAMHAGVPIVATPVGGVPDLLDETTARLTTAVSASAIAAAVRAALSDPAESRRRAGRAAERIRERYALEPWVEAHLELYGKVMRR
jgi:glycosyltransferase involved in cell wall biosynthesis